MLALPDALQMFGALGLFVGGCIGFVMDARSARDVAENVAVRHGRRLLRDDRGLRLLGLRYVERRDLMIRQHLHLVGPRLAVAAAASVVPMFAGTWALARLDSPLWVFYALGAIIIAAALYAGAQPLLAPRSSVPRDGDVPPATSREPRPSGHGRRR